MLPGIGYAPSSVMYKCLPTQNFVPQGGVPIVCDALTCSSLPNNCVADPQSLAVLNLPMLRQDRAGMGITVCTEHTAPPSTSQQRPMGSGECESLIVSAFGATESFDLNGKSFRFFTVPNDCTVDVKDQAGVSQFVHSGPKQVLFSSPGAVANPKIDVTCTSQSDWKPKWRDHDDPWYLTPTIVCPRTFLTISRSHQHQH